MTPTQEFLILAHRHLALSIATRMTSQQHHSLEDAIGIANVALVASSVGWYDYCDRNEYDPNRAEMFAIYAWKRMWGAILDDRRRQGPIPHKYLKLYEVIKDSMGSRDAIAEATGISPARQSQIMATVTQTSIPLEPDHDVPETDDSELSEEVQCAMERLGSPTREVLEYRIIDGMTFQAIATELGLSRKRVMDLFALGCVEFKSLMMEAVSCQ